MPDEAIEWREPELAALAQRYGDATVLAALRIAQHIQRFGIEGIHFKRAGEQHLEQTLPMVTHRKVEHEMKKQVRQTKRR